MTTEETRADHRQERRERRAHRHVERNERVTQRADRREALLDAAIDGIRTHGATATMDALAGAAGITKPILYRHFGDRAGLVAALADRFATSLLADLQAALGQTTPEPRVLLNSTIDAFVGFIEREPELYRFLVHSPARAAIDLTGFLDQIANNVALVVGEQLRALGRDSGPAEPIARGVVAFVHAAGDWWVERRTMPRAQLVTYLSDFLWDGFDGQGARP
ncbi:MAG TPA: TetR/AcrR family transcriptional regulator [Acidimicrobiales bacterium]|nr:TetR/AcrR family transcriptional regulator [Acidimicrobiales bacterium]